MNNDDIYQQIFTYCLVIVIATFAGIVKSIRKFQKTGKKMTIKSIAMRASGDIVISIFAGLMMFLWLQGDTYTPLSAKSAFYISISAYMGSQAIDIFVAIWQAVYQQGVGK
mgnify:CR=1 FL=1